MICIVTYVIGCLFQLYIYMLFFYRHSKSHSLLATIVCVIIGLRTHFWFWTCLARITHILFSWTVSIVLPNNTQFIPVNRMLYIAHAFIWLPVSFVPPHPKHLIELNRMPCIAHATKFWTVFDASVIANVLHLFWLVFYTTVCDYGIAHSFVEGSLIVVSRLDHPAVVCDVYPLCILFCLVRR